MNSNLIFNDFTKQLLAWFATAVLLVQPLGMIGNGCGCSSNEMNATATASCSLAATDDSSCCSSKSVKKSCCGAEKTTCCSASDQLADAPCQCGDQCRCSLEEPAKQLPAIPSNETQNDQVKTLSLTNCDVPISVSRTESRFCFQAFTAYRPALTAQQTCALLSRFIV